VQIRKKYIDRLLSDGWITREQYQRIESWQKEGPFTLHWELRTLLYTGVLLLTSGLGIVIYKNIDTIGHTAIILAIAAACGGCFWYCFKHRKPYTNLKTEYDNPWFDYVLLLGCLLFLALEGYLQFRYELFGTRYGIATLIPALLFFFLAYRFDHIGVLSMAITALASYAGITVSPGLLTQNAFSEAPLIYTGSALSILLIVAGFFLKERDIKRHFTFTWYNFGFNLFFISMLAAMFTLEIPVLYFGLLIAGCILLIRYAIREQSFYLLLMPVIYGYIGVTWLIFHMGLDSILGLYYFVFSCALVIWFFLNYKKILRIK
jgi:hypothetical protein